MVDGYKTLLLRFSWFLLLLLCFGHSYYIILPLPPAVAATAIIAIVCYCCFALFVVVAAAGTQEGHLGKFQKAWPFDLLALCHLLNDLIMVKNE